MLKYVKIQFGTTARKTSPFLCWDPLPKPIISHCYFLWGSTPHGKKIRLFLKLLVAICWTAENITKSNGDIFPQGLGVTQIHMICALTSTSLDIKALTWHKTRRKNCWLLIRIYKSQKLWAYQNYISIYLANYLHVCLYLSIYLSIYLSTFLSAQIKGMMAVWVRHSQTPKRQVTNMFR